MSELLRGVARPCVLGLALGLALSACASSGSSGTGGAQPGAPRARSASSTRMDTTEFRRPEFRTIYDAIKSRHPDWLVARGGATSLRNTARQTPVIGVFIEGEARGYDLDKLTELVVADVKMVRRISGSESLATYGSDWPWGGIVITRAR